MGTPRKGLIVIVGGIVSVPAVALLSLLYLRHVVAAEYASGERVSTGGDSFGIPLVGIAVAWTGLLLVVGATYFVVKFVRWAFRNSAG